jgi:large subunit ribosomal protein L17
MRHKKKIRKLNLPRDERRKLIKNMATSLVLYEQVKTTQAKASAVQEFTEHLITIGKQKDELKARRELIRLTFDKKAVDKIIKEYKTKYKDKKGGYTKIYKIGQRKGDAAPMVIIKFD